MSLPGRLNRASCVPHLSRPRQHHRSQDYPRYHPDRLSLSPSDFGVRWLDSAFSTTDRCQDKAASSRRTPNLRRIEPRMLVPKDLLSGPISVCPSPVSSRPGIPPGAMTAPFNHVLSAMLLVHACLTRPAVYARSTTDRTLFVLRGGEMKPSDYFVLAVTHNFHVPEELDWHAASSAIVEARDIGVDGDIVELHSETAILRMDYPVPKEGAIAFDLFLTQMPEGLGPTAKPQWAPCFRTAPPAARLTKDGRPSGLRWNGRMRAPDFYDLR